MKIPADILTVLTCSQCEVLLYRGPVFQQHDGAAVCGRCVAPERPATRNLIYEAAARMLRFPCKNQELGCLETVSFAEEKQEIAHEQACVHRQYLCPIVPAGQCEWLGKRRDLHDHCRKEHPDKVLRNAGQLTHDIAKSSLQTYVLIVFHFIFLVHTKVCVSTGKIFYSVRCLGNPSKAPDFRFTVDVKRGLQSITKSSRVAPQGCLAIQEDTAMPFNINSLLEMLDGFKDTTFTVTVWDTTGCNKCRVDLSQYFYPGDKNGWLCERCAPVRRACKYQNKGCKYMDIERKCSDHESFFCLYKTQCPMPNCNDRIAENTLNAHYNSAHKDVTYASGTKWRLALDSDKCYLISTTDMRLVRCRIYRYTHDSSIQIYITSSFTIEQLNEMCCEVQLTDSVTSHTKTYKPELSYSSQADWNIKIEKRDFPSCSSQIDVCVTIINIVEC